jgi:WD40 repeat protein
MKPLVLQGHSRPIKDIKFSSKGDIIFTASNDRNVIMWKTETGEKIKTFPHSAAVNRITLTCDMKYMITGDNTGSLYIWEINTAFCLIKLEQDPTYCIRSIDLTLNDYFIMILYASRMKNSKSFISVYRFQDMINLALNNSLGEKEETQAEEQLQNDDFFDGFKSKKKENSGNPLINSQTSIISNFFNLINIMLKLFDFKIFRYEEEH